MKLRPDIENTHQKKRKHQKEKNFCEDSEKPAPGGLTRLHSYHTLAEKFLAMVDSFTGRMSVQRYVDILSDAGFKAVFGDQRNKDVLIDLLNFILPENRKVRDLSYSSTEIPGFSLGSKAVRLDLRCTGDDGAQPRSPGSHSARRRSGSTSGVLAMTAPCSSSRSSATGSHISSGGASSMPQRYTTPAQHEATGTGTTSLPSSSSASSGTVPTGSTGLAQHGTTGSSQNTLSEKKSHTMSRMTLFFVYSWS